MKIFKVSGEKIINIFAMILLCVSVFSAVSIILILQQTMKQSEELDLFESDRMYCDAAISDLMNGSDYLTYEVWQYAVDANPVHMKNFWYEVEVNRSRDRAVQKLIHEKLTEQERSHVFRAKSYSDNLIAGETWAMRLVAESVSLPSSKMSPKVRSVKLNESEISMSPQEKRSLAQSYLMGPSYSASKQEMRSLVQSFRTDISYRMDVKTRLLIKSNKNARLFGTIFSTLLMVVMVLTTIVYSLIVRSKDNKLSMALKSAQAASNAKSYFTARMSHEIRTPLNAVLGYMAIAEEETDEEKRKTCLAKSEIAAKNLLHIVNDVLDLSAIESRRMRLAEKPFLVSELVSSLSIIYGSQAEQKHITLTSNTEKVSSDCLCGDVQRLSQILTNLLSNAIKFTPDGGSVELAVFQQPDEKARLNTVFTVSDSGIGVSPDFMERIFKPYEQADSSISSKYGGTGLGLSIVKNMVELMGGSVTVQSTVGKGSTFTVRIPLTVVSEINDNLLAKENVLFDDKNKSLSGMRILLAEDNEMNSEIAQHFLKELGAEVTPVADGEQAVSVFEKSPAGTYDVILMDVMMPIMNGYDATEKIRSSAHAEAKKVPIIAMTANAFSSDVQEAIASGMNAHVAKPFDISTLVKTLKQFVHK